MSRTTDEDTADIVGVVMDADHVIDLIVGASEEQLDLQSLWTRSTMTMTAVGVLSWRVPIQTSIPSPSEEEVPSRYP